MLRSFSLLAVSAAAFAGAMLSTPASAAIVIGFETGLQNGSVSVTTLGDAVLVEDDFFTPPSAPPEGAFQLLLTTLHAGADGANFSGNNAAAVGSAESFLALDPGTLNASADVSAAKLTLSLVAGDVVTFQFRFLTSALPADGADFAFWTWQALSDTPLLQSFARVADATSLSNSLLFDRQTGVGTVTLPEADFDGSYVLGFGVADAGDNAVPSGLLVDNVAVVPEPASAALLALGAGLLALPRRRRAS